MVKRARGKHAQEQNRRILTDCPVCWICGKDIDLTLGWLDPGAGVVDHVIPLAKGGPDTPSNKRPAHRACNRSKSDKDYAPIIRRSGSLS